MTTDCNGRYVYLDPELGGRIAVSEAARNIVCSGAEPLAITDNLNFGSPEKPEIFWQMEKPWTAWQKLVVCLKRRLSAGM